MPASAVRSIVPPRFVIGRSVHRVSDAAAAGAVDYMIAGAVWATASKPAGHAMLGVDGLSEIVRTARVPVLAIGGVTLDRIRNIAAQGGAGAAGIVLFMASTSDAAAPRCRATPLVELATIARAQFDTSAEPS